MHYRLSEIEELAQDLFKEHGIEDWQFKYTTAKNYIGCCYHQRKLITVSRMYAVAMSKTQIMDTLLHEIAHALAGHAAKHGKQWQIVAERLGAVPKPTTTLTDDPNYDIMRWFEYKKMSKSERRKHYE